MTTNKKVKPIDISASLIYSCPECNAHHWISIKAAQVKGYMIVCDCGCVFRPKRVKDIKIIYETKQPEQTVKQNQTVQNNTKIVLDDFSLEKCLSILGSYGFTKQESNDLIDKALDATQSRDIKTIVKFCLTNIGVNNG